MPANLIESVALNAVTSSLTMFLAYDRTHPAMIVKTSDSKAGMIGVRFISLGVVYLCKVL